MVHYILYTIKNSLTNNSNYDCYIIVCGIHAYWCGCLVANLRYTVLVLISVLVYVVASIVWYSIVPLSNADTNTTSRY